MKYRLYKDHYNEKEQRPDIVRSVIENDNENVLLKTITVKNVIK